MNDDLISRSELKEHKFTTQVCNGVEIEDVDVVAVATIDNAQPVVNEYTKGFSDGERSGRNFPLTDEEKAILVRQWRPQGEWIEDDYAGIHCSECDYIPLKDVVIKIHADGTKERSGNYNLTPYCSNCGAYMKRKEKKNENY